MLLALMLVPIFTVMALAIDGSRRTSAVRHVQFALDAGSLAGVLALKDPSLTDTDVRDVALNAFRANLNTTHQDLRCLNEAVLVRRLHVSVRVSANCKFDAMIGGSITADAIQFSNSATASARAYKLDLSLMLDVSNSMEVADKLDDLKAAATQLVETLLNISSGDRVRIGLVSFNHAVNAGIYGNKVQGLDPDDDEDSDGLEKVCVSERLGPEAWTDDKPAPFAWIGNGTVTCPDSPIVPLTSNSATLTDSIASMVASNATGGHIAVAWSWYLISPNWDSIWPASSRPRPYNGDTIKAVILMTDGAFNVTFDEGALGESADQAKNLCAAMRSENVIVYAVAFLAPPEAQTLLQDCTGGAEDRYFEAETGEDLLNAYSAIASQLSELALSD